MMQLNRLSATVAAMAAVMVLGGCVLPPDKPFDAAGVQRQYRARAAENVTAALAPLPTALDKTYISKLEPDSKTAPASQPSKSKTLGPAVRMKLRDLIQLAAINSLDVRVAGYQPAIDEARVQEAEGRFDPVLFSNLNFATQTLLSPSVNNPSFGLSPDARNDFQTLQFQGGIRQQLLSGAQVQLQYTGSQVFRSGTLEPDFSPATYENGLALQVTQPLLQNFGSEVNSARIVVARNTQRVSALDFRLALEKQLSEIEEAYWQLVLSERELAIQEELYQQTVETATILQKRAAHDVSRVQLGQTNAALRQRESTLVEARYRIRTLSNAIKVRVNDPDLPVASPVVILPDDVPLTQPIPFDLDQQIEEGLENRAELQQQKIRIDSASVVQRAAKNNLLPQLNLVGSAGVKGADGSFGHALGNAFTDAQAQEYAIGFQFEIPIGNREARSIYARTTLQRQQAIDQYRKLIEQVCQEVKDAHDQVFSAWERMGATRQALFAARESLEAIVQEETVEQKPLTPDFINRKLQAQEVLAQAARDDARSISDYNNAIATLERAKGTLLKYDNVIMKEEPLVAGNVKIVEPKKK